MNTHFCVCCVYDCSLKDFCVHMHASSQLGGKHCVQEKLACARVYSKLYYFFGSVFLTITKLFCFGENLTRKPVTFSFFLLKICQYNSNSKMKKMSFTLVLVVGPGCQDQTLWLDQQEWEEQKGRLVFSFKKKQKNCSSAARKSVTIKLKHIL